MAVVSLDPATVDITGVRAGDRNLITVTLHSGGTPLDLTGRTVTAQARKTANDPVSLDAVVEVVDAANGQLSLRWPGDAVRTLMDNSTRWSGVWDLQVQFPPDDPITVCAGSFGAVYDVTR